ncbi:class I SAM-dependent methyltransferase [Pyxidicoccus sp. MSG2]|uniref:class I SAM-dependent methyltransferase n=1 Tax=Pyxidicoccus sp. MSG2 TaxID=2996790 RepID=UPI00226D5B5C|nr:class I SAM-dependent methyltransferase [Pyxidicoccus sp. MSG2]MCY1017471.1 class I SAM-dependent methyltransferase [Pyxidicoccus sp. MSG2]
MALFEDPERDAWQKPAEVIAAMEIPPGGKVADIGAATGYFPVRIARAHPDATVYGVDIEPDMVRYLGERAEKEGLTHLEAVLGEPADAKLPEPVDRVLLVDTYHHLAERPAYFRKLAGSLRPGARVIVVDFKLDSPMGPSREHRLTPEKVGEEMATAGYRKVGERDLPYQYVLSFERT